MSTNRVEKFTGLRCNLTNRKYTRGVLEQPS